MAASINDLPDALLTTIFDRLVDFKKLMICSRVCRKWRESAQQTKCLSLTAPVEVVSARPCIEKLFLLEVLDRFRWLKEVVLEMLGNFDVGFLRGFL
jgi:hypothetical protein